METNGSLIIHMIVDDEGGGGDNIQILKEFSKVKEFSKR